MRIDFIGGRKKPGWVRSLPSLMLAVQLGLTIATGTARAGDTGSVTLRMADQKGGSHALLEAAGELRDLPYKIE
jgi:sulfonate transport system substrate-binding protein